MSDTVTLRTNRRETDRALILIFAIMPVALIDYGLMGFRLSGWAWIAMMAIALPHVLADPIDIRAMRMLTPYLLFLLYSIVTIGWVSNLGGAVQTLLQLCMLAFVYLLGWRVADVHAVAVRLRHVALVGIAVGAAMGAATAGGTQTIAGLGYVTRPAALGLVGMFTVASMTLRSWVTTSFLALFTFGVIVLTGSRAAAGALVIVYLTNHTVRRSRPRWIVIVSLVVLGLLALTATPQFKERSFFSQDLTLTEVVTESDQLNTAGRRELWPRLIEQCATRQPWGSGVGSAAMYSDELTNGTLSHPHNEYLRIYCDQGWLGSLLFWAFLIAAARRRLISLRYGDEANLQTAALQFIIVGMVVSMTDNPLLYTALYMVPLATVLGMAEGSSARDDPRLPVARAWPSSTA